VILTLGLWPFHSPHNGVTWLPNRDGLQFGKYSTVMSSGQFQMPAAEGEGIGSVELWLQPRHVSNSSTILASCAPGSPCRFRLRQSLSDLELQTGDSTKLYVDNLFRRPGPVFLTVTSGLRGTSVYTNGVLARTAPRFRLPSNPFVGRLILADSPEQPDNWSGQLFGLAIYSRELSPEQVLANYQAWTQGAQPGPPDDGHTIAYYPFHERAGNVVHNQAGSGVNLYIPEKYTVLDKYFLEPFWKEFRMSRSTWRDIFKNIVGFVPFGACFFACLSAHQVRRAALATVLLGFLVSLTIEVLQAYLPTRDSGTTDLITNTLGTYLGVIVCRPFMPFLVPPTGNTR
jgi:hypothetical protein